MEFLISESQLRVILMEQDESKLSDYMKQLRSFTVDIVNKVIKNYGINVKMLLTWGTSVGGMMMPLDVYLRSGKFDLNDQQRALVLAGVAFAIFFENKRGFVSILKKIKEEGLQETFRTAFDKAQNLKISFEKFLDSVRVTSSSILDTVAYSFLIPIITDIYSMAHNTSSIKEAAQMIATRLVASGVVIVSKEILENVLKKIVKRLRD
jgi:hypothetical protein